MSRWKEVSPWVVTVSRHLPELSPCQARVLALWSYAVALTHGAGTSTCAALLADLLGCREESVRQRLREWTWEAKHKRGRARREVAVAPCFAGLLRWVLAWWPSEERRLALALDATTLGMRFTVLSVSVVYRGCALPVAWAIVGAYQPGSWQPHWLRLLRALRGVVPEGWTVLVLADQGVYARWLFREIQAMGPGWHPYLRITGCGLFRLLVDGQLQGASRPLRSVVAPGERWTGAVECFTGPARRLRCTLLACWEPRHRSGWLVLTDLAPEQAQLAWYGLRGWIEQGFKDLKRGGWGWHHTKMTDPARAERLWLVLAVATLWAVSVGAAAEANAEAGGDAEEANACSASGFEALPPTHVARRSRRREDPAPRRLSVFRRGQITVLVAALRGHRPPLGFFPRSLWPGERAARPGVGPGRPPHITHNTYP